MTYKWTFATSRITGGYMLFRIFTVAFLLFPLFIRLDPDFIIMIIELINLYISYRTLLFLIVTEICMPSLKLKGYMQIASKVPIKCLCHVWFKYVNTIYHKFLSWEITFSLQLKKCVCEVSSVFLVRPSFFKAKVDIKF